MGGIGRKPRAGFVKAGRITADLNIMFNRGGKFALALEQRSVAMNFPGGLQQQVRQRRMQFFTGNQLHRGADQIDIVGGNVFAQINSPSGSFNTLR